MAALLLDSLDIVSAADMRLALLRSIDALADEPSPSVLIPVLGMKDIRPRVSRGRRQVAYETFCPGGDISVTGGSESFIGNVLRDRVGEHPNSRRGPWIHPGSDIEYLRKQRCRSFVFVTDYSGTGTQVMRFVSTFLRNRTVRSWRSFGWIRFVVVSYAVSKEARETLEAASYIDDLKGLTPATSFESVPWTEEERRSIGEICRRYLPEEERPQALGFGDGGGLFATHAGVPNNVPLILRKTSRGWSPFFEGRVFPPELAAELGNYSLDRDLSKVVSDVNQERLAMAIQSGRLRHPTTALVTLLGLLRRRKWSAAELAETLHLPLDRIEELMGFLRAINLVTSENVLTAAGVRELTAAKALPRKVTTDISGIDLPYYPQSLR
jgi:hypothetical protein